MRRSRRSVTGTMCAVGLVSAVLALVGTSPAEAADPPTITGGYTAITPVRIMDTREDAFGVQPCLPDAGATLQVTGSILGAQTEGAPTTQIVVPAGVAAVALNVTAADATDFGWITVWPSGDKPNTSSVNYLKAQAVPNMVIAKLDPDGKLKIAGRGASCPEGIVDVVGYFAAGPAASSGFTPVTPSRIMDTRTANDGVLAPTLQPTGCVGSTPKQLDVTNVGAVPGSGVKAVVLNVTVADAKAHGYLTVAPKGDALPPGDAAPSNLNYAPGQAVPNMVIVKVPESGVNDGLISIIASPTGGAGCPHVIVDVLGWFKTAGADALGVGAYQGITPARVYDTRDVSGAPCIGSAGSRRIQIAGKGGVPAISPFVSGQTRQPSAVALNVTATDASAFSFATVWDKGPKPFTSNLNYPSGHVATPNMVISKLGPDGTVDIAAFAGCPQIIVDVVGWFAAPVATLTATTPGTFAVSGPVPVPTPSTTFVDKAITLTNESTFNDQVVPQVVITGVDDADFSVVSNTCTTPLAAGASCTFSIRWTVPAGTNADRAAAAAFFVGHGMAGTASIPLTGAFTATAP